MKLKNYNVYFFFLILIAITIASFFLVKGLLIAFILAAVIAHSFTPFYDKALKFTKGMKGLSSGLMCLLVGLIIFIPLILIGALLYSEIQMLVLDFSNDPAKISGVIASANSYIDSINYFFKTQVIYNISINQQTIAAALNNVYEYSLLLVQGAYRGLGSLIIMTFVFFFCLFYLLIDGKRIIKKTIELSPLKDKYEQVLANKFYSIARATIKGTFLLSALQGLIGGILFWATGVSSPVSLAILMTIAAIIPAVGTGFVWLPVGVVMILIGHVPAGIIILVVGAAVIVPVDNILRPKLVGKDTAMHPILILLSTLGGIEFFGIYGLIIGPLILSFCMALWEIYSLEFKKQLKGFNKG